MKEPTKSRGWAIPILTVAGIMGLVLGLLSTQEQGASANTDWNTGDVFVTTGHGSHQVYYNNGVFKEAIQIANEQNTTGCAFNPAGDRFYATYFVTGLVRVFDNASPHDVLQVIDTGVASPGGFPESIAFCNEGNFYVGHAAGNFLIHKYNPGGALIKTFPAAVGMQGTDWIDLSSDQKTLFYTSEGRTIFRYDTDAPTHAAPTQLPDFATLPPGTDEAFSLRILPPGDGSGGVIVADSTNIKQLDATGAVFATYDVTGEDTWFALDLDPDGLHFWAGDLITANFFKIPLEAAAGDYLNTHVIAVNTGTGRNTLAGICVKRGPVGGPPPTGCVDIKPGSDANPINLKSRGVIPVAILGSSTLDVNEIDPNTVTFGPDAAFESHRVQIHFEDVNNDGVLDAMFHFRTQQTGISDGDSEACISWRDFAGDSFTCCDSVRTVPSASSAGQQGERGARGAEKRSRTARGRERR